MRLLDLDTLAAVLLIGGGKRLVEIDVELAGRIVRHVKQRNISGERRSCPDQSREDESDTTDHLNLHMSRQSLSATRRETVEDTPASQRNRISMFAVSQDRF